MRKQDGTTHPSGFVSFAKENGGATPQCLKIPLSQREDIQHDSDIHHTCDSVYQELHSQGVGTPVFTAEDGKLWRYFLLPW